MSNKFGTRDKYYTRTDEKGSQQLEMLDTTAEEFVQAIVPRECENRVRRATKQWNSIIREHLRSETGFKLNIGEERGIVRILVDDGYPNPFVKLIEKCSPILWELKRRKADLKTALGELDFVRNNYESILEVAAINQAALITGIDGTAELFHRILDFLAKSAEKKIDSELQSIDHDILGAYFFHRGEIKIYWKVIGLFAGLLGVTVEDLSATVLTHELAHAYTHIGRDIDGKQWDTRAFANTDLDIVEGIAQFYTCAVCSRFEERAVGVKQAFDSLLAIQGGPYVIHKKWLENNNRIGEAMRACLIETRTHGITEMKTFEGLLKDIQSRLQQRSHS